VFTSIDEIATGKIATYDLVKNNIVIENNVTLKKNDNIMKGEILKIDFNTGISQINNKKESEKVKMRFLPKKSDKK
jgi:lipopolysaccharide export system protein LptA